MADTEVALFGFKRSIFEACELKTTQTGRQRLRDTYSRTAKTDLNRANQCTEMPCVLGGSHFITVDIREPVIIKQVLGRLQGFRAHSITGDFAAMDIGAFYDGERVDVVSPPRDYRQRIYAD